MENFLFSGDELQYRTVGGTTTSPVSSFEAQVQSIRNLYNTFPDETIVYPGHGRSTTIGDEKIQNSNITPDKAIQK
ncbi:MAG: MBL fold metallo-hydrolase [Bacteroidales bacterium]|nr:MBL fold metallo-hydrolase [Bacteroidales bacterium]